TSREVVLKLDFTPEEIAILARALAPEMAKELRPLLKPQGQDEDTPFFLTVETLAQYLNVKKTWVYERVHLKEIPHYKAGRFPRFKKADIDRWLQETYTPAVNIPNLKRRVAQCQK
ncbi:MAG: helix-turn-helix domain-containing protein, partial [Candidatus Brocadiales bacterium]